MDWPALVIADHTGTITHWSPGAELAFGHRAEHVVGKTLDVIVPEQHRAAHWVGFRRALASGKAAVEGQVGPFPVVHLDGKAREVPGRLTLLRRANGEVFGAMVVFG